MYAPPVSVPLRRHQALSVWALILLALAGAALTGLAASTGNALLMAAVVGPLLGAVFLVNWQLCFWTVAAGFLLVNGPLQQFAPQVGKTTWALSGLSLLLMGYALVQLVGLRRQRDLAPASGLAWATLALLLYAAAASFALSGHPGELLAGFKRYFQTWGVFLALAVLPVVERDLRRLAKLAVIVAVLHLPLALYQYFFVFRTGALRSPGALDVVVGIFEGNAEAGGASGVMSLYLVVAVAVIIRLWLVHRVGTLLLLAGLLVFGAPLALGEAKVVVVVLPLAVALAMAGQWHTPRAFLMACMVGAAIFLLGVHFISLNAINGADFDKAMRNILAYNVGSVAYDSAGIGLNRSTVLLHWWAEHGSHNPQHLLLGHGLGSSYWARSALAPGHLFAQYPFMNINLTTLSTILWDLGLVGLLFFGLLIAACWAALRRGIRAAGASWHGELFRATEISLLVCVLSTPYNNSLISFGSHATVFALTLGVCAYASRWARAQVPTTP